MLYLIACAVAVATCYAMFASDKYGGAIFAHYDPFNHQNPVVTDSDYSTAADGFQRVASALRRNGILIGGEPYSIETSGDLRDNTLSLFPAELFCCKSGVFRPAVNVIWLMGVIKDSRRGDRGSDLGYSIGRDLKVYETSPRYTDPAWESERNAILAQVERIADWRLQRAHEQAVIFALMFALAAVAPIAAIRLSRWLHH